MIRWATHGWPRKGKVMDEPMERCSRCDGFGHEPCPCCGSLSGRECLTGVRSAPCRLCGGAGEVPVEILDAWEENRTREEWRGER